MKMRRKVRQTGQALPEFAIVLFPFLLLFFGIIEFGRAVYTIQALNNAAHEAARYAIVHGAESTCPSGPLPGGKTNFCDPSGARVKAAAKKFAIGVTGVNSSDLVVTPLWCEPSLVDACKAAGTSNGTDARSQTVVVTITYTYRPILGLVPLPTFNLTGGSTLVINH